MKGCVLCIKQVAQRAIVIKIQTGRRKSAYSTAVVYCYQSIKRSFRFRAPLALALTSEKMTAARARAH